MFVLVNVQVLQTAIFGTEIEPEELKARCTELLPTITEAKDLLREYVELRSASDIDMHSVDVPELERGLLIFEIEVQSLQTF